MSTQMIHGLLILIVVIHASMSQGTNVLENQEKYCRDRLGYFHKDDYKVTTCSMCYFYLVLSNPVYVLNAPLKFYEYRNQTYYLVKKPNHSEMNSLLKNIYPTLDNVTAIQTVCKTLSEDECTRWKSCCQSAWACCLRQLENTASTVSSKGVCPKTFDGWTCWESARPNTTSTLPCPGFLTHGDTGTTSHKACRADGTWDVNAVTGLEQTDYEDCTANTGQQIHRTVIIIGTVLNTTGSLMLMPLIVIFTKSRPWRKQQRIKIHINLSVSVLLSSVLNIVWDICVRQDRLDHTADESFLRQQQFLCKTLFVIHQCLKSTTFFWMTCEGYFLHRLIVNAFLPPRCFYRYLLYGWGVPITLFVIYGGVRKIIADDSMCWILPLDGSARVLEWLLVFTPIAACLMANLVIFANIMRLMMSKIIVHPEDTGKFRRAMKATGLLVPLFGLYLFCFMYRPKATNRQGYDVYEIFSAITLNSQGVLVSVVLFYGNGEVQAHLKTLVSRWRSQHICWRRGDDRKLSMSLGTGTCTSRRTSVSSLQNTGLASDSVLKNLEHGGSYSSEIKVTQF